jgi:hypothetical protein
MKVPVVDSAGVPLMPTTEHRAIKMVKKREATPFWKQGVWCIRLNKEPSARNMQPIVAGVDPGSKREAIVLKSEAHTIINVQMDAVTYVSNRIEIRRNMRRSRRKRKTPYRQPRSNRARKDGWIPPSTKARWQWKLRVLNFLAKLYPITDVVVEDVKAHTQKGMRQWNANFSIIEGGKTWFYDQIRARWKLWTREGWQTAETRKFLNLRKTSNKMAMSWTAHCVDAWCLAYDTIGGENTPDDTQILHLTPLKFRRRQLHMLQPSKGDVRRENGGTRSCGVKRGSLVRYEKFGVVYIGGKKGDLVSLHDAVSGKRLTKNARSENVRFLAYNSWRSRLLSTQDEIVRIGIASKDALF